MKKLLSVVTFVVLLCSVVVIAAAFTPHTPPVTQLLTDHTLTAYDAETPEVAFAPSELHVVWPEYGVFSPGTNTGDMDLFYASLPGNNTQRIRSAEAITSGQGITQLGPYRIAVGTNGQVYLAWIEPTAANGSDAFFWKTGMSSPQNISDHALTTTGNAATLFLALDTNNTPHVLWVERETSYYSVFYWKEGANTSKLSVVTPPVANLNATKALDLISQNGVVHAFWRDMSPTTNFGLYYWNSNTQTAINIRAGQPNLSDPTASEYAFVSPNGTFHAVWEELFLAPPNKIAHWDSGTAAYHTILSATSPFFMRPVMDPNGHLHIVNYENNGPLNHWDSQTLNNQQLAANIGSTQPALVAGKGNIPVYVAWRAADPNWPTHFKDLFYWYPGMAQPQNVSDHSQSPADVTFPGYLALAAADNGSVHIAWEEGAPTYYNSMSNQTTTLNNTLTVQYDTLGADSRKSDTPYLGYQGMIFRVYNNIAYWFLASTSQNTATPYTLWRSDNSTYIPIPAVYGTDNPVIHGSRMLWFDRFGQPQLAWITAVSGEQTNLHYWNSEDGSIDVTDNQNTSWAVGYTGTIGATDDINRVYLIWRESDENPEYLDVYATVKEPVFNNNLFLPLLQR